MFSTFLGQKSNLVTLIKINPYSGLLLKFIYCIHKLVVDSK
jgi:hypothetical protein